MPRYFMHLRDRDGEMLDPDGVVMAVEAVPATALLAARDCIAGDARGGRIDLRYWIDVHDDEGNLVHTISFAEACEIVPA